MLEEEIAGTLKSRGLTISVAEACTMGLVAYRLTSVAGSSGYFIGGILAYANSVKKHVLNVPEETLNNEGSVSEAAAIAMARGARRLLNTDLSLSTTGITGPGGGTPERPVGLFFMAVAGPGDSSVCERHVFKGNRSEIRSQAAEAALQLLKRSGLK